MPTNEDRRYANKEEIDQAYQEIRAEMCSLTGLPHSLYRDNDVVETIGTQTIFKIYLERRIAETNERILRPNGKPVIGGGACNVAENLIFARSELPSFDWPISLNDPNAYKKLFGQNKRYSDLASAILDAKAMILLWFMNVKLCLLEESSDEISLESVRESFNESFPFSKDDWDLLWDRWKLEYSRLLRDLHLLPVSKGIDETGKQAVETVENGDGLPSATLDALIGAGFGSVLNAARKLPAVNRHSRTMMEMLAKDASKYDWTLDDWVVHLRASKRTINECDAWKHILQWREDKKQQRPRAE